MTGVKPNAAGRYLEGNAEHCPHCEEAAHFRRAVVNMLDDEGDVPRLYVECTCVACRGEWVEGYTLSSVRIKPLLTPGGP
jgi:hypothetical protein